MKFNILFVLFYLTFFPLFSQKINRSLPRNYREYVTREEYRRLLKYTLYQLEGLEVLAVKKGVVRIQLGEEPYSFHMLPIIQQCAGLNNDQQQIYIRERVTNLINAYYDQEALASADFSIVKKYLSLRLYPEGNIADSDREHWVIRSDIVGTVSCVMMNLPTAFATVSQKQLQSWGVDEAEIFRIAQENSRKRSYEIHRQWLNDSTELIALTGGEYAASAALVLEQAVPEAIGHYGAIVSIPHRDMILLHNLKDADPQDYQAYIEQTYAFVLEQYAQHSAPILPDFYWYYQGKFTRILLGTDPEGRLQIIPPGTLSHLFGEVLGE